MCECGKKNNIINLVNAISCHAANAGYSAAIPNQNDWSYWMGQVNIGEALLHGTISVIVQRNDEASHDCNIVQD